MNTTENKDCQAALLRMIPQIDMGQIRAFIDEVPGITELQKAFYKRYLDARHEFILAPVYEQLIDQQPGFVQTM